ncbi:hypothetical protein RI129_010664 [Pyrocoelia pectoralis]|uniref:Uncharacterized protein n=1 Tax=Pyrocoelia pectoralis TaxID=417401 RepID=A0AAN7V3R6_9COLE
MKKLVIFFLVVVFSSSCNAQRPNNCTRKRCDEMTQVKDTVLNFPFGCIDSESLNNLWRCMCENSKNRCLGDVYNDCSSVLNAYGDDEGCETCNDLQQTIDSFRVVNYNCFCSVFLETVNACLCSEMLSDCPGAQFNQCFQQAGATASGIWS